MHIKKIGVIATSAPGTGLQPEVFQRGLDFFASKNIEITFAANVFLPETYVAGTISERVVALETFLRDPSIDLIMAFWGGHQTHQIIPHLDSELLNTCRKPIIGYSDLTPLLNYIAEKTTNIRPILGPAFISFCKPAWFDYTWDSLLRSLEPQASRLIAAPCHTTNRWYKTGTMEQKDSSGWKILKPGQALGAAVGGNMGSLLLLAGTPYWPNFEGKILFLEEDESECVESLDRFLTHFLQIGVFEKVSGIVFGRFMDDVVKSEDFEVLIARVLADFNGPVIYEADFGHSDPIFSIPLGRNVKIHADKELGISYVDLL